MRNGFSRPLRIFYAKETNHRFYSYRMKQQGRSWSSEGTEYMVWVLTARKNKTLTQALLYHVMK